VEVPAPKLILEVEAPAHAPAQAPSLPAVLEVEPDEEAILSSKRVRSQPFRYDDGSYKAAADHDKQQQALVTKAWPDSQGRPRERCLGRLEHVVQEGMVPTTRSEADNAVEAEHWKAAHVVELENLRRNETFRKFPKSSEVAKAARRNGRIRTKPVYDRKMCGSNEKATGATYKIDPDGTKIRFKSRLVAMGFLQMPGSFGEKYAGTPSHVVNRLLFPLAMLKGWRVKVQFPTPTLTM
jgi:hypothetical protein